MTHIADHTPTRGSRHVVLGGWVGMPAGRSTPLPGGSLLPHAVGMSEPFIVLPNEGRLLELGTLQAVILASAEQTADQFTLLRTKSEPPGFGPPLHLHRDSAEAFFVLQGEYLMFLNDEQHPCPAGSFAYVPRGTPHTFKVTSSEPGTKLNLFTPAAMVRFLRGTRRCRGGR
jgi:mannose-6-phosphate isomerase-like protein (cupin superfamily)